MSHGWVLGQLLILIRMENVLALTKIKGPPVHTSPGIAQLIREGKVASDFGEETIVLQLRQTPGFIKNLIFVSKLPPDFCLIFEDIQDFKGCYVSGKKIW